MKNHSLLITAIAGFCINFTVASGQSGQVETTQFNGLSTVSVATEAGTIQVHLPRFSQGAALSGTVSIEPKEGNKRETADNKAYLNGLVVDFEGAEKKRTVGKTVAFVVPVAAAVIYGVVKDQSGRTVGRFPMPVDSGGGTTGGFPTGGFNIPPIAQAGEPLFFPGSADGNLANTVIRFNGEVHPPIAEGPDGIYVRPTPGQTGNTRVDITEGGVTSTGFTNLIGVNMTAGQLNLNPGQSTDLQATVTGLEGIQAPVTILLQNESPAIVQLSGGNRQCITINPGQAVHTYTGVLEGQASGAFGVTATVLPDMSPYLLAPADPRWNDANVLLSFARILEEWAPRFALCDPEWANTLRRTARDYTRKAEIIGEQPSTIANAASGSSDMKADAKPLPLPIPVQAGKPAAGDKKEDLKPCNCDQIVATITIENTSRKKMLEKNLQKVMDDIKDQEKRKSEMKNDYDKNKVEQKIKELESQKAGLEQKIKDRVFEEERTIDQDISSSIAKNGDIITIKVKVSNVDSKICDCTASKDCAFQLRQITSDEAGRIEDFYEVRDPLDEFDTHYEGHFEVSSQVPSIKLTVIGKCVKPGCKDSSPRKQPFQITFQL